ncbi:glycosyltransferase 87 family protein [uncultured Aurantimicrobium sp.]|uniref:glycosyltransferase 87 family protein n=1 Tax=uncultured Aurantimicrobium sp. TaxID=1705357 RepID=UPI00261E0E3C|nr:glycosyltransferase 87 family protein [uncultured Aurantimicrobium sp.]
MWFAFGLISLWLGWQGFVAEAVPYGDVSFVYEFWAGQAAGGAGIVGIDSQWVYPAVALVPILLPLFAGPGLYPIGWIVLVTLLNAGAFAYLLYSAQGTQRNTLQRTAAWWWLVFMLLLGPIAVARLDSIVTPLAIVGLLMAVQRPAIAGALLAIATWIKVWPAALIAAVLVAVHKRKTVLISVLVTSAVVIAIAVILGGAANIFSFLGQQTTRGLQIEAPLATPFLWLAAFHEQGYAVYYDTVILTFQVMGEGTGVAADLSSLLLGLGFIGTLMWGLWLHRRGSDPSHVLPAVALSLTVVLIVFNKVGSPQYIGWLAAPIIAGLVLEQRRFFAPAVIALVLGALTQAFYPYLYNGLLNVQPLELSILTLRNIGELVLLAVSATVLYEAKRREI